MQRNICPQLFAECGWDKREEKAVMRHLRERECSSAAARTLKMQRKERRGRQPRSGLPDRCGIFGKRSRMPGLVRR